MLIEKKLQKLLEKANKIRKLSIENGYASFYNDFFYEFNNFIVKSLNVSLHKKRNAEIISNHFDEILPFIVSSNTNILLINFELLSSQPNFKEKFIAGLKNYPYKDEIEQIFYNIWAVLNNKPGKYDEFLDEAVLTTLASLDISGMSYTRILNKINEENQKLFLMLLVENKKDIPYSSIEYKGNNKQIIYDNLPLFIKNAQNLYSLMNFVKDDKEALEEVKKYIDTNADKAIDSIFCGTEYLLKISDSTLKEILRLLILDVVKNEEAKFSEITYNGGGFSRILIIGDKVIKLGDRATKTFPNNPYIISPLFRKELKSNGEICFVEVTERVNTNERIGSDELYQLFKKIRDLGLVWTDIKEINVGRLRKENIIHWNRTLAPTEEVLGLKSKRGDEILKEGDLVILDADFIYEENDPNINFANNKTLYDEFEAKYQSEKLKLEVDDDFVAIDSIDEENEYDSSEHKKSR